MTSQRVGPVADELSAAAVLQAALEVAISRVDAPLVLAISGGRDSMALMHAMRRWAPDRLAAVATFDHGTGGYATESAALVATEARRMGLTVVRERARTVTHTEAGWREARWRFLQRVARAYRARVVTAHTQDDQAETVVMRLLRGSGTRGLAALAAPSPVVRPWLAVSRAEVAAWAQSESIPYLEDPMNASRHFQRGRVRHDLLPAMERAAPGITAQLLASGEAAAEWRRGVETFVDGFDLTMVREGVLRVSSEPIDRTTDEGRAVLWPALFARVGVVLDARGTRALVRFSHSTRRGAYVELAGGAIAIRVGVGARHNFELRRPSPLSRTPSVQAITAHRVVRGASDPAWEPWTGTAEQLPARLGRWRFRRLTPADARAAADDRWLFGVPVDATVTIRGWTAGDRIFSPGYPAGRRVTRYFSDRHIPALDRSGWPVVLLQGTPLCVPGLCRAEAAPNRPGWPDSIWYRCEREFD
ncbi:MAG: tRNA lysidine(34) synthetase TilS [Gemmatimonadaceae bacterium]|nr:tRNA lysidine(34) synthetase TilS [Gemmatimonadaceae bacterium]